MDLRLYSRVVWRFRFVVAIGLVLAAALSFLSFARISFAHGKPQVTYRQAETWQATVSVLLTQTGFPYGYTVPPQNTEKLPGGGGALMPRYADVSRFAELAVYYAPFVQSDAFLTMLRQRTHIPGIIQAEAAVTTRQSSLPYVVLSAFAAHPAEAVTLANDAGNVFLQFIVNQQDANGIPPGKRVVAEVATQAQKAILSAGRKKTTPIVVFLTVLLAAIGLAFILENLRPRIHAVAADDEVSRQTLAPRRIA